MRSIRKPVFAIILYVVDNDGDFIRIVGVGTQRTQSLLNVQREGLGRSGENNGLHIGHVETFAEKFGVAEDFDIAASEVVDDMLSDESGSFSVTMSGGDIGGFEGVGDGFGVINVDAITNGGFTCGEALVIVNDVSDDVWHGHYACEVGLIVVAETFTDVAQVNG